MGPMFTNMSQGFRREQLSSELFSEVGHHSSLTYEWFSFSVICPLLTLSSHFQVCICEFCILSVEEMLL